MITTIPGEEKIVNATKYKPTREELAYWLIADSLGQISEMPGIFVGSTDILPPVDEVRENQKKIFRARVISNATKTNGAFKESLWRIPDKECMDKLKPFGNELLIAAQAYLDNICPGAYAKFREEKRVVRKAARQQYGIPDDMFESYN